MDRDNNFDRLKLAYDAIVYGNAKEYNSYEELINENYNNEVYDEFVIPGIINKMPLEDNDGIIFNIALNYGGRDEIVHAVKNIALDVKNGKIDIEKIDEDLISNNLYTTGQPDPDLLIRTSGELRLSNFLPWQLVYSEFYFTNKLWPDFSTEDLDNAILEYSKRTRKFGGK